MTNQDHGWLTVCLGNNALLDPAGDIGEAEVAAGVVVGELFVIEPEEVQEGGVEIVHVDAVGDGSVADFIGCAVGVAGLGATAGKPGGEAARVVIAAILALRKGSASELSAPPDESVFEEAALFEILKEGGDGFVGGAGVGHVGGHVGVLVPPRVDGFVGVVDLDKADALFGKPAGHEALAAVVIGCLFADAIHGLGGFGFVCEVENVRGFHLHAEGKIKGVDGRIEVLVGLGLGLLTVEFLEEIELLFLTAERKG